MIEVSDLVLLGTVSCLISAAVCILAALVMFSLRQRDVEVLYRKIESMDMAARGQLGRDSRAEQAERMNEAMLEAMAMYKEGKPPAEILKELGPKYPDVIMKLAGKVMSGKLKL